ncbi:MAG TPA: type IX secretion system membrane protein PorP/SprF, partial [Flavobacteriales bacterium]|nr:type IX secretion system membrane protein PorP/SprF [Flavobacteriales bacterium]
MKARQIFKNYKRAIILVGALSFNSGYAQDIHFSQFYQVPQLINPSLAGGFNGDFRAIVNFRDQWSNVAPYKT